MEHHSKDIQIWSQPSRTKQTVRSSCGFALSHFGVQESCIRTWIVLACRMARGTDQVFIHILLRAVAQISIGERDFRYFRFHWWGPKKNPPIPSPPKKRGDSELHYRLVLQISCFVFQFATGLQYVEIPFSILSLEVIMSDIRSMLSSSQSRKDLRWELESGLGAVKNL